MANQDQQLPATDQLMLFNNGENPKSLPQLKVNMMLNVHRNNKAYYRQTSTRTEWSVIQLQTEYKVFGCVSKY